MDRRFDRTERAITKSFTELLCTTSYASITVSQIIERAGIGRSTFYAHYHSKDDVLLGVVHSICDHVLSPVGPESGHNFSGHHTSEALIEHTLLHLRERESGIRALVFSDGADVLARCLREQLIAHIEDMLPQVLPGNAGRMDRAFVVRFLAGSFLDTALRWAHDGFIESPARIAEQYLLAVRPMFG